MGEGPLRSREPAGGPGRDRRTAHPDHGTSGAGIAGLRRSPEAAPPRPLLAQAYECIGEAPGRTAGTLSTADVVFEAVGQRARQSATELALRTGGVPTRWRSRPRRLSLKEVAVTAVRVPSEAARRPVAPRARRATAGPSDASLSRPRPVWRRASRRSWYRCRRARRPCSGACRQRGGRCWLRTACRSR